MGVNGYTAIFLILEHIVTFDGMGSLAAAFVAMNLPLSSMWAATKNDVPNPALASSTAFYHKPYESFVSTTQNSIDKGPAVCQMHGNTHSQGVCVEKTFEVASRVAGFATPGSSYSGRPLRDMYDIGESEPNGPV